MFSNRHTYESNLLGIAGQTKHRISPAKSYLKASWLREPKSKADANWLKPGSHEWVLQSMHSMQDFGGHSGLLNSRQVQKYQKIIFYILVTLLVLNFSSNLQSKNDFHPKATTALIFVAFAEACESLMKS